MLLLVAVIGLSVTVTFDRLALPEGKLIFTGRVLNDKGQVLDSVKISLRDSSNRRTFTTYYTDKRGKFKIKLDYGQVRNVHFEVDGYVAMFARFETEVPSSKIYNDYYFDARIDLLNDTMDFNKKTIARNAFMTVRFNSSLDHFAESFNKQMTFFEQLAKPNLGLIKLRGYVRDSLLDTINVRLSAYDMNTNEVLDTAVTAYDGYYEMEVPLQREVKVQLESKEHYAVYTTMKTIVPTKLVQKDFELNKSFDLIPRDNEDVNRQAFALPVDAVVFDSSKTTFSSQPKVVEKFEEVLNSFPKTIKLAGKLNNVEGRDFVGTTIMVKDGNRLINETKLDSSNSFEVEMPYQSIVHVNFKTTGYHEGFISYNTNMSKSEMHNAAQLKTDVELYNKDRTDINAKAFEFPMAKYYYDKKQKGFTSDTAISNAFYKALHEIKVKRDSTPAAAGFLVLTGSVKNPATNKRVPEAKLRVLDAQKNVLSYFNADKRARFNMRLNLNRIYYVELESPGYHNTLLKFNTHVSKGKENTDIEQDGLEALIIHEQDILAGKPVPAELMKDRAVTSFYYAEEEGIFVEDLSTFDNFRIAVENYKPKEIEKIEE
ncbi:MAG: hypothetical protein KDC37_03705, partial [Flavobacteriales bacterium]|nr:hypothetical protein [Flavobacteriales bacterium]